MRNKIRIDNFLNKVNIRDLLINIWKICDDTNVDVIEKNIIDNISYIREQWYEFFDFRFSQILIYLGFINNTSGCWFYYDEEEILKFQGYKPRDYKFWGSIYNKDGELLPETKYNLVKDLDINHMQRLVDGKWLKENTEIFKVISDELRNRLRKEKLKKIKWSCSSTDRTSASMGAI